jgi:hypothetical protein
VPAGIDCGDLAGYIDYQGYVRVSLRVPGHKYTVKLSGHRIAWYLLTGKWPRFAIDHRDRNRANNRWSNLRRSTPAVEKINQSLRWDNKTGVRGVFLNGNGRYEVALMCDHMRHYIGSFPTLGEAAEARYRAERDFYGRLCASSDRRSSRPAGLRPPSRGEATGKYRHDAAA